MYGLKKKLNSFINASIGISAIFTVLGILFLIFPETSLDVIRWLIAATSGIAGVYLVASDFSKKRISPFFSTVAIGAVLIIIALVFAVYPNVMNIFPIVIGAWFIVSAISSLRFAMTLRGTTSGSLSIIAAVLSIICGILLIFNPWGGQISLMIFAGIMMIVYGISNIIEMLVIRQNVKVVSDNIRELAKSVEEEDKSSKK
ncbi:DUF308 domain-containing protein [Candidatus Saccharibacteria bacterium]|nr:DUF308 domain-containing protein [Candidatus Saccharibacteria bacterium]